MNLLKMLVLELQLPDRKPQQELEPRMINRKGNHLMSLTFLKQHYTRPCVTSLSRLK